MFYSCRIDRLCDLPLCPCHPEENRTRKSLLVLFYSYRLSLYHWDWVGGTPGSMLLNGIVWTITSFLANSFLFSWWEHHILNKINSEHIEILMRNERSEKGDMWCNYCRHVTRWNPFILRDSKRLSISENCIAFDKTLAWRNKHKPISYNEKKKYFYGLVLKSEDSWLFVWPWQGQKCIK